MSKKIKHFLVTGGVGFIGSGISRFLVKKGYKVTIFDNNSRGSVNKIRGLRNSVNVIHGDIRDYKKLEKSLKGVDAVIHLAYVNGTKFFYSKPILILDIATKGIINIIDACVKNKIKELYLASSSEVYQTPNKIPTNEMESLKIPNIYNPRFSYGGGKILTELMGVHYGKKYFNKLIIFRPHNVYGPDMGNEHVIPEFIKRMKKISNKKNFFTIKGSGNESRSFIYIDDFVSAFSLLIKKGKHLNIYNIGTTERIKIKNLAKKMSNILKKKILIRKGRIAKGGTKNRCPDIKKIKKLGFRQKILLEQGLRKTIDWYY